MPFDQFGFWQPLHSPKTKLFLYNDPAIICQAINIRNQKPCANRIYGKQYNQCRECGTIVCFWHSGYRYKGYMVCDACYSELNKLYRTVSSPIFCNSCKKRFKSYQELQKHYQPQEIEREKLYRIYKINHGKLLSQYDYTGPWLYKVPEYNRTNKNNLNAINPEDNIHIIKAMNPGAPIGKYQFGWVMPFYSKTTMYSLNEIRQGEKLGEGVSGVAYKRGDRVYKISHVSNMILANPDRTARLWNEYFDCFAPKFSTAKAYTIEGMDILETPFIAGRYLNKNNALDFFELEMAHDFYLENIGREVPDYRKIGNVIFSDELQKPVFVDFDTSTNIITNRPNSPAQRALINLYSSTYNYHFRDKL